MRGIGSDTVVSLKRDIDVVAEFAEFLAVRVDGFLVASDVDSIGQIEEFLNIAGDDEVSRNPFNNLLVVLVLLWNKVEEVLFRNLGERIEHKNHA